MEQFKAAYEQPDPLKKDMTFVTKYINRINGLTTKFEDKNLLLQIEAILVNATTLSTIYKKHGASKELHILRRNLYSIYKTVGIMARGKDLISELKSKEDPPRENLIKEVIQYLSEKLPQSINQNSTNKLFNAHMRALFAQSINLYIQNKSQYLSTKNILMYQEVQSAIEKQNG